MDTSPAEIRNQSITLDIQTDFDPLLGLLLRKQSLCIVYLCSSALLFTWSFVTFLGTKSLTSNDGFIFLLTAYFILSYYVVKTESYELESQRCGASSSSFSLYAEEAAQLCCSKQWDFAFTLLHGFCSHRCS